MKRLKRLRGLVMLIAILAIAVSTWAATITVPDDYPTIQAAIDAAQPGDTVYVKAGRYTENIVIDKPIFLVGEDRTTTIIQSPDSENDVVEVNLSSGEVSITGLNVYQGRVGIFLELAAGTKASVTDVITYENAVGIYTMGEGKFLLAGSFLIDSELAGLWLASGVGTVEKNEILCGGVGLLLVGSVDATLDNNLIGLCRLGIYTYTQTCGWANAEEFFSGAVAGSENRVYALNTDLCPGYPGVPWPEGFVALSWVSAVEQAAALFMAGAISYDDQDFSGALRLWLQCLAIVGKNPHPYLQAMTHSNIGGMYLLLANYDEALKAFQAARPLFAERGMETNVAEVDQNLGALYVELGQYEKALEVLNAARAVFVHRGMQANVGGVEQNIGLALRRSGRYEEALAVYEAAEKTFSALEMDLKAAEVRANIGAVHAFLGRYEAALEAFRAARTVFADHQKDFHVAMAEQNIGLTYYYLDLYEPALISLQRARDLFSERGMDAYVARVNRNIGLIYSSLGWHTKALTLFEESRDLFAARSMYVKQAEASVNVGFALAQLGRYEEALTAYKEALSILDTFPASTGIAYSHPDQRWTIEVNRGFALESLGQWTEAVAAYTRAASVIESIREQLRAEELKLAWGEHTQAAYERLIDLLFRMSEGASAFPYAERCRARTFLDILYGGGVKPEQLVSPEAGIAAGVVDPEAIDAAVKQALGYLEPTTAVLSYLVTERGVYLWVIARDQYTGRHEVGEPRFLPYAREELLGDVIEMRRVLESMDRTLTAQLRLPELLGKLYERLVQPGLTLLPEEVNTLVFIPSGPLWYLPFAALVRTDEPPLTPDSPLPPRHPGVSRERPHYLVDSYTIAYLPSLASLPALMEREEVGKGVYVGLANPVLSPQQVEALGMGVYRYKELEKAVVAFARRLVEEEGTYTVYVGAEATEEQAHRVTGHRVVVYAAHGQFSPYVPLQSQLFLAPGEGARVEGDPRVPDGNYRAWEVLLTDHRGVELVVLAACESLLPSFYHLKKAVAGGLGADPDEVELTPEQLERITTGDEVVGFARAFLSSGAQRVLGTQWLATAKGIAELLPAVGEHSAQGLGWAEALQFAQLELLSGSVFMDPFFWAPFQLIGRWR